MADILIADDDRDVLEMLAEMVARMGHLADPVSTLGAARERLLSRDYDVVFLDLRLPDGNGLSILPLIKDMTSEPEVIIITGHGDAESAELAMKNEVWDYIQKPSSLGPMRLVLTRALQYREKKSLAKRLPVLLKLDNIVGSSQQLKGCFGLVAQAAQSDINVLITGETGTGKELFARAIHDNSHRAGGNFVVVDCAAIPENLVESILFGHEKGAFTSADRAHEGLIKEADKGTLFLDEIGELSPTIQKSFLRVLQERVFRPVGSHREDRSDFRLIAATNRRLDTMVADGAFRTDLLFRVQAFTIELPPLRERKEDIKELLTEYLTRLCNRYGTAIKGISPGFIEALMDYDWPGNVREFINALDNAVCNSFSDSTLFPKHLPAYLRVRLACAPMERSSQDSLGKRLAESADQETVPLMSFRERILNEAEKEYLTSLMNRTSHDVQKACRISGLSRSRFYALLKKYDLLGGSK